MQTTKNKLYFKVFAFIVTTALLIAVYLYSISMKIWVPDAEVVFLYGDFTLQYLSFFTTQSNIIVALWFLLAIINHKNEDQKISTGQTSKIFVTSYITITALVWITILLPTTIKTTNAVKLTFGIGQHVIVPAMMIIYTITSIGINKIDFKQNLNREFLFYLIYPLIYIFYVMIRGEMRWADNKGILSYPYFFLNLHEKLWGVNGAAMFIVFILLIFALFIGAYFMYLFINNYRYKKMKTTDNSQLV